MQEQHILALPPEFDSPAANRGPRRKKPSRSSLNSFASTYVERNIVHISAKRLQSFQVSPQETRSQATITSMDVDDRKVVERKASPPCSVIIDISRQS